MQGKFDEIIEKVYGNPWGKAVGLALVCSILYLIRKHIVLTDYAVTLINIGIGGFALLAVYQMVRHRTIPYIRLFLLIAIAFITNEFYIPEKFYDFFNLSLKDACIYAFILGGIWILFPVLLKGLNEVIDVALLIISKCVKLDENKLQEKKKRRDEKVREGKKKKERFIEKIKMKSGGTVGGISEEPEDSETESDDLSAAEMHDHIEKKEGKAESAANSWLDKLTFTLVLLAIVIVPVIFIIYSWNSGWVEALKGVDTASIINIVISLMSLVIFGMFVWTVVIGVILKLAYTVFNILKNKEDRSYYLVYSGAVLLVSAYFSKQYGYTLDDLINTVTQGDIFSFPLIIIILLPVFLTFLDNFRKYLERTNIKEGIVNLIHDIASSTVISLLQYIKFVTADFLSSVAALVEEDLKDDGKTKEPK